MIGLLTMEEKRYDVAAVKERLNEYREKERDIDNQIERLVRLVTKMSSVGAQTITDMPRSQGTDGDRIGKLVAEKEELEADIRSDERDQKEEWGKIEAILSKLKHSDERAVIRIRYHDRESWSTVAEVIFGNVEDYLDREGTYIRRVHKIHGSALLNMAKIMENGEPDTRGSCGYVAYIPSSRNLPAVLGVNLNRAERSDRLLRLVLIFVDIIK